MTSDQNETAEALKRGIQLHQEGELTKAERAYEEVLKVDPKHPDALHLLGVIAHQMGNSELAIERISQSLEINDRQPRAHNHLGNIYCAVERWDDAIASYQQAIDQLDNYADAYLNLGHALAEANRNSEARDAYARSIDLQPEEPLPHIYLGQTNERLVRQDEAVAAYRRALELDPESVFALRKLGLLLRKLNRLDEAADVYDAWLSQEPEHAEALHLRDACRPNQAPPSRASDDYVQATFDGFAEDFESCLKELGYRVPELVTAAADEFAGERTDLSIIDLGCGTGLCGPSLKKRAATLHGLDLSRAMLEKARERELYDELYDSELGGYLSCCNEDYDLLVSADTLVYVGDLEQVCEAGFDSLRPGGGFIFNVELVDPNEADADRQFHLNRFGRYTHTEAYVTEQLTRAGFEIRSIRPETLRTEGGVDVTGLLVVAVKPVAG